MDKSMPREWEKVREQLKEQLKPGEFVYWIHPLGAAIFRHRIELISPNDAHKNYIKEIF
jgi:chromosomal replication initiation ATPase DnaA